MKKRITLFLMAFVAMGMLMTSCTKDNAELILGTWTMDLQKSYEYYSENGDEETYYMSEEMNEGESAVLVFNADGTGTAKTMKNGAAIDEQPFIYLISEDKITLMGQIFTIEKLTKKALVLELSETDDGDVFKMHWEFTR